jgi:hypothetical protein
MTLHPEVQAAAMKIAWEWIKDREEVKVAKKGLTSYSTSDILEHFRNAYQSICKVVSEKTN